MANSPGHPEGLSVLLSLLFLLAVGRLERTDQRRWAVAIGVAIGGALLLKVNVGLFLGAVWAFLASQWLDDAKAARIARILVVCLLVVAPVAMMWSVRSLSWVPSYAVFATIMIGSAVSLGALGSRGNRAPRNTRVLTHIIASAGGLLGAFSLVLAVTIGRGTSFDALFEMTFTQTFRFVRNWQMEAFIGYPAWISLLASLSCVVLHSFLSEYNKKYTISIISILKIIYIFLYFIIIFQEVLPLIVYSEVKLGHGFFILIPMSLLIMLPSLGAAVAYQRPVWLWVLRQQSSFSIPFLSRGTKCSSLPPRWA